MAKYTQTCLLCKQTYEYCGGCSKYKNLPTYMTTFCSENCKNIYQTMADFENGLISKDKAKISLLGMDTSRHIFYTNSFASSYKKIMDVEEEKDIEEKDIKKNDDKEPVLDADVSSTISEIIDNNTISADEIKEIADSVSQKVNNNYRKNKKYSKK